MDSEKLNILFKNLIGVPSTKQGQQFHSEIAAPYNTNTLGQNILLDSIPEQAPDSLITFTSNTFDSILLFKTDTENIIRKYINVKLQPVPGSNNKAWYRLHNNSNILTDTIQFNHGTKEDGNYTYVYKLYKSTGNEILFGDGDWLFDTKSGIVTFYDNLPSGISSNTPPYLSFYKYVGNRGISNLSLDTVTERLTDIEKYLKAFSSTYTLINTDINKKITFTDNGYTETSI